MARASDSFQLLSRLPILLGLLHLGMFTQSVSCLTAERIFSIAKENLPTYALIETLVGRGEFDGYILQDTFWKAKRLIQDQYPKFIGEDIKLGTSLEGRELKGFLFGRNINDKNHQLTKSIILIDSVHHAREAIGLELILTLMLQELSELIKNTEASKVYDTTSIFFYPVVNPDGFAQITKPGMRDKRKNMRVTGKCLQPPSEGVDINRNYDIHFNKFLEITSDPCTDEFRGAYPFSEPETQAVRAIFDEFPHARSALNFHSYGNLWIQPYNFNNAGDPGLDKLQPELYELYQNFKNKKVLPPHAVVGNALDTLEYYTSGEASDWMSVIKGVFVWSPELGPDQDQGGDGFSTTPGLQRQIVKDQLPTVTAFIRLHTPDLSLTQVVWQADSHKIMLQVNNVGYADIYNLSVRVETEEPDSLQTPYLMLPNGANTTLVSRMSHNVTLILQAFQTTYPRLEIQKIKIRLMSGESTIGNFELLGKSVTTVVTAQNRILDDKSIERAVFLLIATAIFFVFGILILLKCLKRTKEIKIGDADLTLPAETGGAEMGYFKTNHEEI